MTMSYLTEETEEFIGRDQEIKLFSSWLEDSSAHRILFFHDAEDQERKGGIGKTRLLKRLIALVNERYKNFIPVPIDFFNITERNAIIVAERVVRGLQARFPDWSARSFEQLRETQKRNDRESLVDAFIADLRALEERMAETNSHLLLFFDTFEVIEHNPVIAVLDPSHTFPDNYQMSRIRAVIAGRNAPVWSHQNWVKRQHEVKPEPLSPFTPEEMRQYVALNADIDVDEMSTEILKKIYEKTEGRPILIGLVVDFLNRKVMSLEKLLDVPTSQFEEYLVGQINQLDSPQKRAILIMAHIYHRFNAELLDMIMQKPGLLS